MTAASSDAPRVNRAELNAREQTEEPGHRSVALHQLRPPLGVIIAVVEVGRQLLELLQRDRQLAARNRFIFDVERLAKAWQDAAQGSYEIEYWP